MNTANARELKLELNNCSNQELVNLCLRLSRFKKENKELLSYLLFEAENKAFYVQQIKEEVDEQFEIMNRSNYFLIKKSVRRILKSLKKYIRFTQNKEIEVELLIYFCQKLRSLQPSYLKNVVLTNTFNSQLLLAKKALKSLDEDLQYDLGRELEML